MTATIISLGFLPFSLRRSANSLSNGLCVFAVMAGR